MTTTVRLLIPLFSSFELLFPLPKQRVLGLITITRSTQFLLLQYPLFPTQFLAVHVSVSLGTRQDRLT